MLDAQRFHRVLMLLLLYTSSQRPTVCVLTQLMSMLLLLLEHGGMSMWPQGEAIGTVMLAITAAAYKRLCCIGNLLLPDTAQILHCRKTSIYMSMTPGPVLQCDHDFT